MLRVELIYDTDCPNVQRARQALLEGLTAAGLQPSWTEWDRKSAKSRRGNGPLVYVGLGGLVAASLWNSWPKKRIETGSCANCITQDSAMAVRHVKRRSNW